MKGLVADSKQQLVIEAGVGDWLLVVAGPGSGKTQVAAMRLVHLLDAGIKPAQILVLSFSRSAVATLKKRIAGLNLPDEGLVEDLGHLAIRTFDSWAFRMLRQAGSSPAVLLSRTHDENIDSLAAAISDRSNVALGERLSVIRHVIVDEFQDLPGVRAKLVTELLARLSEGGPRIGVTVLGDPAQAIFRFAARRKGEAPPPDPWDQLKSRLKSRFQEIVLDKNHRSTDKLAKIMSHMRVILQNPGLDPTKKLSAMQKLLAGLPSSTVDLKLGPEWLAKLPEGSVAVLTRTNGEALQVSKMLIGNSIEAPSVSIQLRLAGASPPVPAWIAGLLARFKPRTVSRAAFDVVYSKLEKLLDSNSLADLHFPQREVAWTRLARASGASDDASVVDLDALRERIGWSDAFPDDHVRENAGVYITTVHQAKGMEFDNVALLEGRDNGESRIPDDPLEEASVGFVAITRASRNLGRLPSSVIYRAPREWSGRGGRSRQVAWGKMLNVQMGLTGDVESSSFVDMGLHGGKEKVDALQQTLMNLAGKLRGHKVTLHRIDARARDVLYDVRLQVEEGDGLLLGRTATQLTMDLLEIVWGKGYSLPMTIYNLRIGEVITVSCRTDVPESVPDPWQTSGLWLGISLFGTGDFKLWRRNG
jgi:DNA helicase-2/ATP-dependent DNA helicase PcrA